MPTARKDVAYRLNEAALEAANVIISMANGEIEVRGNTRQGACKLILNKVVPDLKAVEAKIQAQIKDVVDIGGED